MLRWWWPLEADKERRAYHGGVGALGNGWMVEWGSCGNSLPCIRSTALKQRITRHRSNAHLRLSCAFQCVVLFPCSVALTASLRWLLSNMTDMSKGGSTKLSTWDFEANTDFCFCSWIPIQQMRCNVKLYILQHKSAMSWITKKTNLYILIRNGLNRLDWTPWTAFINKIGQIKSGWSAWTGQVKVDIAFVN